MSATDAYRLSVTQITHQSQGCCANKIGVGTPFPRVPISLHP